MSQPTTRKYPAEFKERAAKLAVESEQPIAQTARDLGVNENTLHTLVFYQFRQLFYAASPLPEHSWDFSDSFSGQPL